MAKYLIKKGTPITRWTSYNRAGRARTERITTTRDAVLTNKDIWNDDDLQYIMFEVPDEEWAIFEVARKYLHVLEHD